MEKYIQGLTKREVFSIPLCYGVNNLYGYQRYLFFCFVFSILFLFSAGQVIANTTDALASVKPFEPPSNFTATAVSVIRIDLSWSSVSEAVSYKVYRAGILIASLTATSYSDTGLTPGTTYSYTVSSVNIFGGESEQSSSISATTPVVRGIYIPPTAPPPSPLSLEAQKIDTNNDAKIDFLEFNILMVNWGATTPGNIADFNDDNIVDIFDFNLLMIYWTL